MSRIVVPERRILLPQILDVRLKGLARLNQETAGVLVYEKKDTGTLLDVNGAYMLGRGKRHEVELDPQREAIVEDFFERNGGYGSIGWHTHVSGNREPSKEDLDHYAERIRQDPEYIGMVITPSGRTTIKSKESGIVRTSIIPTPRDFERKERILREGLEHSARRLGLEGLPRFKATRKR